MNDQLKETKANISSISKLLFALETTQEKIENQFVRLLVKKTQREMSIYPQIEQAIRAKLDGTHVASHALKENYQNALANFHYHRPLYDVLAEFINVSHLSDVASSAFYEHFLAVGALLRDNESHHSSDNGSWMMRHQHNDARTGAPVYRMSFMPVNRPMLTQGETHLPSYISTEVGHIDLYGVPHLCRSAAGDITNVVETAGIFENETIDPKTIQLVCSELPPTIWDVVQSGVAQGALRGAANVIGKTVCSESVSETTKGCVQDTLYFVGYFAMRFYQHLQEKNDVETAAWKSAADIFEMCVIAVVLKAIEKMLVNNCSTSVARNACSFFFRATPFVYSAYQKGLAGVSDMATFTVASIATQSIVEKVANDIKLGEPRALRQELAL